MAKSNSIKYLTKSRFKLGLECPNKLFFTNKEKYADKKNDDTFLQALANGGFQVEELARMHYPNGVFINTENYEYEKAVELTNHELAKENVVIYEAAFLVNGYFIRTDIIEKIGNKVRLIEVKAKSFNPNENNTFIGKKGNLVSSWKPKIFDLAFQKKVAQLSQPNLEFEALFMMADKTKKASINGLNQMFRIPINGNPRVDIIKGVSTLEEIGDSVLSEVNVDEIVNDIIENKHKYYENLDFDESMVLFKEAYQQNNYLNWPTQFSACKKCEFKTTKEEKEKGLLSGFEYCYSSQLNWSENEFSKPNAMEIWNFRGGNLAEEKRLFLDELDENDFKVIPLPDIISSSERQWIQVEKSRENDTTIHIEKEGLTKEMSSWKFPLHFIDFETSTVALPFTAGRHPYEQVAFQFSHHIYYENGVIDHKTEFISNTPGEFPNFIFVRALQKALLPDDGSIFRFAAHENSILNAIIKQLNESNEIDKFDLISFLKTITKSTNDSVEQWEGIRSMIDLNKVVKDYYYNPYTKGSNSIKSVLPAVLKSSTYLQNKYSKEIGKIDVKSSNFKQSHIWLKIENNEVVNPYKMLPSLFDGWSDQELDQNLSEINEIADGGAALSAYAKLQYQDMSKIERNEITSALLKYCELDTLAMVMIYEHFKNDLIC